MKKRRMFIFAFIICAIFGLGIGYANVADTLTITGTGSAVASADNFTVAFDKTVEVVTNKAAAGTDATITADYSDGDDITASIAVSGLTTNGQYATATYTIKNSSEELGATLTATVTNSNEDYFEVTYDFADESIAKDSSTTVTITVKLIKTPIAEQNTTITVTITATATVA